MNQPQETTHQGILPWKKVEAERKAKHLKKTLSGPMNPSVSEEGTLCWYVLVPGPELSLGTGTDLLLCEIRTETAQPLS